MFQMIIIGYCGQLEKILRKIDLSFLIRQVMGVFDLFYFLRRYLGGADEVAFLTLPVISTGLWLQVGALILMLVAVVDDHVSNFFVDLVHVD